MIKPEILRAKKTKANKKRLAKDCMELWADIVKKRAGHVCEYPGCHNTNRLNAHHIFTRAKTSTRYDVENGLCLCPYHHSLGAESAHRDPQFKDIIIKAGVRTQPFYDKLRMRAFTPAKVDLELEKLYLEQQFRKFSKII